MAGNSAVRKPGPNSPHPGPRSSFNPRRLAFAGAALAIDDYNRYAYEQVGGTLDWPRSGPGFPINERMIPQFEEKVLEVKENSQIVQDWKGNICEISNEFTTEYLRESIDFVTRRWVKCPVASWPDWEQMKTRYDAQDCSRFPRDPVALGATLRNREWPVELHFSGPFWQMREWLGFEGLCTAFYDSPDLIRDMVKFWTRHIAGLLEQALEYVTPDSLYFSEDMAYKSFSMISPAMVREFLSPAYNAWGAIVRAADIPVYAIDSDGFIGELIPIWIDAGVNLCDPMEVAAGNDLVALRSEFGRKMAFRGGVDKRAMAKGGDVIRNEMRRLQPVVDGGGYIPCCDHGVPADVPWQNYLEYIRLLATATGWL